jgi:RHS repeat-associated protein
MPEFMSQSQVVAWQKDRIAKADAAQAAQAAQAASSRPSTIDSLTAFYTGKPYLAESGSYAFKYREYNPEMNRWTTVDPSGFPDGANNRVYVNNSVLTHIDNNGCQIADLNFSGDVLTAVVDWNIAETYAQLADPLTYTAMTKAESSGSSWINDSSLNTTVKNSSLFTGTVTSGVSGWLHSNVSGNGNMGVNMTGLHNDGSSPGAYYFPAGDLSTALHGVLFSITGSVSGYGTTSGWQYGATVSYSKEYTFENHYQDVNPSLVNWIGVTLQKANLIFPFPIAGSFASKWIE